MKTIRRIAPCLTAVVLAGGLVALAQPGGEEKGVSSSASFTWIFDSDLDVAGGLRARWPLQLTRTTHAYLELDTQTAIRREIGELTFDVRELNYNLEFGATRRLQGGGGFSLFAAQRGREMVDRDGQPYVRYLGVGYRSPGLRVGGPVIGWAVRAGAVFEEREIDADATVGAALHFEGFSSHRFWRRLGFDIAVDGLVRGGEIDADLRVGPRLRLPVSANHSGLLYLHYLEGEHPLGLRVSGLLLGFEYVERPGGPGADFVAPGISGAVEAGGGEGRESGRLRLLLSSPPLARGGDSSAGWLVAEFDANVLTARDTGELYYFYHLGYERPLRHWRGGLYYYHRSNHQLAEANDRVTSINVLEAGIETPFWSRSVPSARLPRRGHLDYRARVGYLVTSSFGEQRRWHVRAGARWATPWRLGAMHAYLMIELEDGDVARQVYAAGLLSPRGLGIRLDYRNDDQFFGRDRTALLLIGERKF